MAANIQSLTDEILDAYDEVIGPNIPGGAKAVVPRLDQTKETATYFTDLVKNLQILSIADSGQITIFESQRKRKQNEVVLKAVGEGTYGTVYRNKIGNAVYKKILFDSDDAVALEECCREVFLESFIQTVLALDPEYGDNVCKIIGLYRESPQAAVDRAEAQNSNWNPDNNNANEEEEEVPNKIALYIKMESISKNVDKLLEEMRQPRGRVPGKTPITWATIKPILSNLGTMLEHFETNYNFHHRDLHTGNVMFDAANNIKLIDFGRSCLQLDDTVYSVERENIIVQPTLDEVVKREGAEGSPCESYDMLIFMTCLLEYDEDKFDEIAKTNLNKLVTTAAGTNLFKYWNENKEGDDAVFWKMYPNVVASWEGKKITMRVRGRPTTRTLSPSDSAISSPHDFVEAVEAAVAAGGRRKTRKRSTKRRSTTRRRHY